MDLKRQRAVAKERMEQADKERKKALSTLCRINAKYYKHKEEYHRLDKELAEQNVEVITTTKVKRSRPTDIPSELENLTTEQIQMLAARIEQQQKDAQEEEELRKLSEEEEEDNHV